MGVEGGCRSTWRQLARYGRGASSGGGGGAVAATAASGGAGAVAHGGGRQRRRATTGRVASARSRRPGRKLARRQPGRELARGRSSSRSRGGRREEEQRRSRDVLICGGRREQGVKYELHFICDVNSTIPQDGVCYCPDSYSYPFSHMNILARPRGSQNDEVPTLFFIQCSNSEEQSQDTTFVCCPVSAEDAGRCYHCEYDGIKIIHPSTKSYLGRCTDFEEMARGESGVDAQGLVEEGQSNILFDGTLEYEDSLYFDPALDVDFRKFIDQTARDQARQEKMKKEQDPGRSVDYSYIDKIVYEYSLTRPHI